MASAVASISLVFYRGFGCGVDIFFVALNKGKCSRWRRRRSGAKWGLPTEPARNWRFPSRLFAVG